MMHNTPTDLPDDDEITVRARLQQEIDEGLGDEDFEPLGLDELSTDDREALTALLEKESLQAEFDRKHPILSYLSTLPIVGSFFRNHQHRFGDTRSRPARGRERDPFA